MMKGVPNPVLISVITVCRNSARTISRTFDSMLQQGYPHVDYVVIDGASSDGTVDVIKEYETRFKSKGYSFRWISESDKGIYDAINKGIAIVHGDVIGILNSDDFYEPNSLQLIAEASVLHPEVGIFYGFLRVMLDGEEIMTYRYRYERYLLNLNSGIASATQHPTCFVRKSVYNQVGVFDQQFSVSADHDFLIRAMQAGIRFLPLEEVLSNFSSGGASDQRSDYDRLKQRYGLLYKNGLLSESQYKEKRGELRYKKYKEFKRKIIRRLFGF